MTSIAGKIRGVMSATLSSGDASPRSREGTSGMMGLALVFVIVAGAALRLWQYAANTSLMFDELALAKGILALDLWSLLTTPLPYNQVSPKGFILVQKLVVTSFGPSDYALRLFPLVCSLVSLVVFGRLARRILDGVGALAAVVLFAMAAPLIAFSALVKQYSTDVCVAVLLWWLACELIARPLTPSRAGWAALLGSALVWFSQPGVLMIAALGAALAAWPRLTSNGSRRAVVPVLACWGASALAATAVAFANLRPDTREYVQSFWAAGFAPLSPAGWLETRWPLGQVRALFGLSQSGLAYPRPVMYVMLTVIGFAGLWRQKRRAAVLLMSPLVVTLGAAVVRQYPFSDRLILFLVPSFMLAIAAAIASVRRLLWPFSRVLGAVAVIGLLLPTVYPTIATPPAYQTEHMKPVLSYLQSRRQPGDGIYVYYGAAPAVTFYGIQYGLGRSEYVVGGCHRGDGQRYLQEIDTFRGRSRVWVLLTHANLHYREREDILAYLDTIGTRHDSLVVEPRGVGLGLLPAAAYLYDLSIAHKLANGAAASFQMTGPVGQNLRCGVGPVAMVQTDFR